MTREEEQRRPRPSLADRSTWHQFVRPVRGPLSGTESEQEASGVPVEGGGDLSPYGASQDGSFARRVRDFAMQNGIFQYNVARFVLLTELHAEALAEDAARAPHPFVEELKKVGRRNALRMDLVREREYQSALIVQIADAHKQSRLSVQRARGLEQEIQRLS